MMSKEFLKELAEKYGVGYSEVEPGHGGSIIDESETIKEDVSIKTVRETFSRKYKISRVNLKR